MVRSLFDPRKEFNHNLHHLLSFAKSLVCFVHKTSAQESDVLPTELTGQLTLESDLKSPNRGILKYLPE